VSDTSDVLVPTDSFVGRLIKANPVEWGDYVNHPFVRQLAAGTLPEPAFRHYLGQDYLFLIHFARAYGLAVYKSDNLADMRAASGAVSAILDVEMELHVKFCADWSLSEAEMAALPEDPACMAYTRFVLERGMAGDLLDLLVALAPCVVGYGVIGQGLDRDPATVRDGNRYADWIDMYAGDEYREVVEASLAQIDRLAGERGGEDRFDGLSRTYSAATVLEARFWQMGLEALQA
jgi:thiaminase/transcriptional activator TenA